MRIYYHHMREDYNSFPLNCIRDSCLDNFRVSCASVNREMKMNVISLIYVSYCDKCCINVYIWNDLSVILACHIRRSLDRIEINYGYCLFVVLEELLMFLWFWMPENLLCDEMIYGKKEFWVSQEMRCHLKISWRRFKWGC